MQNIIQSSSVVQRLFSFLWLILLALPVRAIVVDDLYVADVLVADESAAQLSKGARAGLLQVLVRVSGRVQIEESSLVRSSLRNPAAYYYQFSYETTDKTLLVNGEEINARRLRLHFEPSAIARLLRDANLPVWGSNRPSVLLWVAINEGQNRRILSEADADPIVALLLNQARERGLPVMFPILDIEDAAQVSAAEVWGAFLERIEVASQRYNTDAILTARLQEEAGDRWTGRWSYLVGEPWQSVESVAFSADELVGTMINQLADDLAGRFALGSSRAQVTLEIEGVATVSQYAALSRYLEALTPVLSSTIVSLEGDVARYELETEGQYEQLVELIKLDERLVLLENAALNANRNGVLRYRWTE